MTTHDRDKVIAAAKMFRGRPRQPKMKKIKLLAYMHIGVGEICYRFVGESVVPQWIRVPSEDKEIEVPE